MSYRPYPSADRARRQLARHQPPTPNVLGGIAAAEAIANLQANMARLFSAAKWPSLGKMTL